MVEFKIKIKDREVSFKGPDLDQEIDIEDLLTIEWSNLQGEMATMPMVVYKIGLLKADADKAARESHVALEILKARIGEDARKKMSSSFSERQATVQQIENAVSLDQGVQLKTKEYESRAHSAKVLDVIYRAILSKDSKISSLSRGLNTDTLTSRIESTVNGIMINGIIGD